MPMVYDISLATPGVVTTNGTGNTENNTFSVKPGVRNVALSEFSATGRVSGGSTLSGIVHRLVQFGTASTGGTGVTPTPRDPGWQAAKATVVSGATVGSSRTNRLILGHGVGSGTQWMAKEPDSVIGQQGGGTGSLDALNVTAAISQTFEWSGAINE